MNKLYLNISALILSAATTVSFGQTILRLNGDDVIDYTFMTRANSQKILNGLVDNQITGNLSASIYHTNIIGSTQAGRNLLSISAPLEQSIPSVNVNSSISYFGITGSGKVVMDTDPALKNIQVSTINNITLTAPLVAKTLTILSSLSLSGTDGSTLNIGSGGTLGTAAYTSSSNYEVPLTFSSGLTRFINTISLSSGAARDNLTGGTGVLNLSGYTLTLPVLNYQTPLTFSTGLTNTGNTITLASGAARANLTGGAGTLNLSGYTVTLPSANTVKEIIINNSLIINPTSNGTIGDKYISGNYLYICTDTNTWVRTGLQTTW